ncbi:MAG: VOC family protein [Acidobacteriaceae bacterium]|nr:VOC family protein [Acidobacteriaceae bacterium]
MARLRILAVVDGIKAFADFMHHGLGLQSAWTTRHGPLAAEYYAFASGDLLVVEPREGNNPVAGFLEKKGPGIIAFGLSDGSLTDGTAAHATALCDTGPLSVLGLVEIPTIGIALLVGNTSALESGVRERSLILDHAAYVVADLDEAVTALKLRLGIEESSILGRWRFPEFNATNAVLLFDRAYIELNQAWSNRGLFGAHFAKRKAGGMFICLRSKTLPTTLARLDSYGVQVGEAKEINALAPGQSTPIRLGTVHSLPRDATQNLNLLLFDTSWPWGILKRQAPGTDPLDQTNASIY